MESKPEIRSLEIFEGTHLPASEIKLFLKWARRNGYRVERTYPKESKKRAFSARKGCILFMGICRHHMSAGKTKKGDIWKGHGWGEGIVLVESNISVFKGHTNLAQFGLTYRDFLRGLKEGEIQC